MLNKEKSRYGLKYFAKVEFSSELRLPGTLKMT
jgi:hypothetical protein